MLLLDEAPGRLSPRKDLLAYRKELAGLLKSHHEPVDQKNIREKMRWIEGELKHHDRLTKEGHRLD